MAIKAVTIDSLGTLVRLEPPAPRLRAELERIGHPVPEGDSERAIAAEVAYYVAHHTEARDASSLAELRNRCAGVLVEALGVLGLSVHAAREALLAALVFKPFPDAAPALAELRERGLRLVVASNWDWSLREVLSRVGLVELVDEVVPSAAAGAAKPDQAVFEAALAAAGCSPEEAVHVGDSLENDVAGARAAGLRAVLLDRDGSRARPDGVPVIATLAELPAVLP